MKEHHIVWLIAAFLVLAYVIYWHDPSPVETFKEKIQEKIQEKIKKKLYYVPIIDIDTIRFEIKGNLKRKVPKKNVLSTNADNMKGVLGPRTRSIYYMHMAMLLDLLEEGDGFPRKWRGTTLCIDTVDLLRARKGNLGSYKKLDTEGYFVRLVHPERVQEMSCPYDISGKRIGVFDICDYHLASAIANGYRLPYTDYDTYTIDFIPPNQWTSLERLLLKEYDVMYAYIIPKSNFEQIIYSQRVYISGFDTMDVTRIAAFYPDIKMLPVYMEDMYKWDSLVKPNAMFHTQDTVNLLWVSHYLFTINVPKKKELKKKEGKQKEEKIQQIETFISRLEVSEELSDPSYRCYGDIANENRALCNSSFDAWGNPKETQTYWDLPCVENTDCPFYKANKNYPNEFGKCLSKGVCEFPVGTHRLAYTKYDTDFPYTPMCYGCEPGILNCCEDQEENPEKYPSLLSPDYVFPNDRTLREPRNMETIIPML